MENKTENCKICGAPTDNQIELVTVKTMVDRGWRKNKYYQAMGDIINTAVCDECLDRHIERVLNPSKEIVRLSVLSAIVFLGCIGLFLYVPVTAFQVFCGIIAGVTVLAFLQEFNRIRKRTESAKKKSENDLRKDMAVDLLSRVLPKKHVDAELQYIDVRRIMRDNLEMLGKEYGVSSKKLVAIRNFLKEEKKKQNPENQA